jgi:uncharacterized protein (TIGR03435 family)
MADSLRLRREGLPLQRAPEWLNEAYDIDARADTARELSGADLMEPLKALLAERLKLVVHFERRELPVYLLKVTAAGSKLKGSDPNTEKSVKVSGGKLVLHKMSAEILARALSNLPEVRRTVIDETGLTGDFDIALEWVQDTLGRSDRAPDGPSLFTALQEQLGLCLVASKAPDEALVIDGVERPSAN